MICRKNKWNTVIGDILGDNTPLINGLIGFCQNPIKELTDKVFLMDFRPEFIIDDYFSELKIDKDFLLGKHKDANLGQTEKFEYAYAITVHLSQGSSWKKVLVFDEWLGNADYHNKWLYTAITRAEQKLVIAL